MKILVGCEFSGVVRDEFIKIGHDAISCDLLPTEKPGPHYQGNIIDILYDNWDMLIAFPSCQFLASSGLHWNKNNPARQAKTEESLLFVKQLLDAPIEKICLENPIGCISTRLRKPDQIIQPWMFGEDASKATCLWLKGLDKLVPTDIIKKNRYANQCASKQNNTGSKDRWKRRSRTFLKIAEAMASQWG